MVLGLILSVCIVTVVVIALTQQNVPLQSSQHVQLPDIFEHGCRVCLLGYKEVFSRGSQLELCKELDIVELVR